MNFFCAWAACAADFGALMEGIFEALATTENVDARSQFQVDTYLRQPRASFLPYFVRRRSGMFEAVLTMARLGR